MRPLGRGLAAARSHPSVGVREGRLRLAVTIPRAENYSNDGDHQRVHTSATARTSILFPHARRRRWSPQQIRGLDLEAAREPVDHVDAGSIDASLNRADIGAIDLRTIGKLFLRQALSPPEFPQIERQHLSDLHP